MEIYDIKLKNKKRKANSIEKNEIYHFAKNHSRLFPDLFNKKTPIVIARAPARLDVMGGIADYSGSIVCEGTLKCSAIAGVQKSQNSIIKIQTNTHNPEDLQNTGKISLSKIFCKSNNELYSREDIQKNFKKLDKLSWTAYALGGLYFLLESGRISIRDIGLNIGILSTVPLGNGVSSSASLEVSSFMAILGILGMIEKYNPMKIAQICQKVENEIVGAPCGIMDQVTCILGEKDTLLKLRCQPHTVLGRIDIPKDIQFVGINSNVKHSVGGKRYRNARIGAFMGHKIIVDSLKKAENPYGKYLCNIKPSLYKNNYKALLPEEIEGLEFKKQYQETYDALSNQLLDPNDIYSIKFPTEHPIMENARIKYFISLLEKGSKEGIDESLLMKAGKLMYESHNSYSECCNLGAPETDLIVKMIQSFGVQEGFYGAKITGGGAGGTVAVLCRRNDIVNQKLESLLDEYKKKTHITPQLFSESSEGAWSCGIGRFTP
jgi:L-arabinokinase